MTSIFHFCLEDSILHQSNYFHVTKGLVPDIMHDVLEGCLSYVIKVFINGGQFY